MTRELNKAEEKLLDVSLQLSLNAKYLDEPFKTHFTEIADEMEDFVVRSLDNGSLSKMWRIWT